MRNRVRSAATSGTRPGGNRAILWPSCYTAGSPDGPYQIDQFGACRHTCGFRNVELADVISSPTVLPQAPGGVGRRRIGDRLVRADRRIRMNASRHVDVQHGVKPVEVLRCGAATDPAIPDPHGPCRVVREECDPALCGATSAQRDAEQREQCATSADVVPVALVGARGARRDGFRPSAGVECGRAGRAGRRWGSLEFERAAPE
jgi:hypothetical protein